MNDQASADLREEVRSRYAAAARAVLEPQGWRGRFVLRQPGR